MKMRIEPVPRNALLEKNPLLLGKILYTFRTCGRIREEKSVYFIMDGILAVNLPHFSRNEKVDIYFSEETDIIVTTPLSSSRKDFRKERYTFKNLSLDILV